MRIVIQIVLWVIIVGLGYLLFNSIYGEVKFNELKEVRYLKAVNKLKDIRDAQLAHKQVTKKFAADFTKLEQFIDTAEFTLIQRRDTVVLDVEQTRIYGVDTQKDSVVIDTIGTRSVKDSLFGATARYKTMKTITIEGKAIPFEMEAGTTTKNDIPISVFEAKVSKDNLLFDQPKDYLVKEKQVISVDGVNGEYISVGSMTDVSTKGNWPQSYDTKDEQ